MPLSVILPNLLKLRTYPMPWEIAEPDSQEFAELRFFGVLTKAEISKAAQHCIEHMACLEQRLLLTDCSEVEGGHNPFDLLDVLDDIKEHMLKIREAVILPASSPNYTNALFWESACINRGLKVRIFESRDDAHTWLMEN